MVSKKAIGVILVLLVVLVVVMFGDAIVPTITSSPVQFDLTNPSNGIVNSPSNP